MGRAQYVVLCIFLLCDLHETLVKICVDMIFLMPRTTYTSSSFRVGLKLCRKLEGLAYENAENRYPQCMICAKYTPWHTYAQLKSPAYTFESM